MMNCISLGNKEYFIVIVIVIVIVWIIVIMLRQQVCGGLAGARGTATIYQLYTHYQLYTTIYTMNSQ